MMTNTHDQQETEKQAQENATIAAWCGSKTAAGRIFVDEEDNQIPYADLQAAISNNTDIGQKFLTLYGEAKKHILDDLQAKEDAAEVKNAPLFSAGEDNHTSQETINAITNAQDIGIEIVTYDMEVLAAKKKRDARFTATPLEAFVKASKSIIEHMTATGEEDILIGENSYKTKDAIEQIQAVTPAGCTYAVNYLAMLNNKSLRKAHEDGQSVKNFEERILPFKPENSIAGPHEAIIEMAHGYLSGFENPENKEGKLWIGMSYHPYSYPEMGRLIREGKAAGNEYAAGGIEALVKIFGRHQP